MGVLGIGRLKHWLGIMSDRISTHGADGLWWSLIYLYTAVLIKRLDSTRFDRRGEPIYERSWDLLVVLDACRGDMLREFATEYPFVDDETTYSVASSSETWMKRNFGPEYTAEMQRTAYVTGNPFSDHVLSADEFGVLDEVWKYAWDDDPGTIPPQSLTDRAIHHGRTGDYDRIIVHYMQPHFPSIPYDGNLDPGIYKDNLDGTITDSVWDRLRRDEIRIRDVWEAYRMNLEFVLNEIRALFENIDAETAVVTADHGNAVGDYGFYGHRKQVPLKCLREVPWCQSTATDKRTYDPPEYDTTSVSIDETTVEDRLSSLGYK